MLKTVSLIALFLFGLVLAAPAQAACKLGGKTYPEGTTYSVYVCKDGKWVKRR